MFLPSSFGSAMTQVQLDPVDEAIWYPDAQSRAIINTEFVPVGVNMGMTFLVQVIGELHTLCYYRAASTMPSSGTMALWQIDHYTDVLLASVDFTGHSGTGWKTVPLPTPIEVNASHAYVVHLWLPSDGTSVDTTFTQYFWNTGQGAYSSPWGFVYGVAATGNDDPIRGFTRINGLIKNGAFSRPTEGYIGNHWWVDVIVNARPKPIPPDPPLVLKWPIPDGWPSADNTGPDPDTVFEPPIFDVYRASGPGVTIENLDLRNGMIIGYPNVTIRNCRIRGTSEFIVYNELGVDGMVLEDCFIDGVGKNNPGCTAVSLGGVGITVQRCNIQRVDNGFTLFGGATPRNHIIKDNFVHHLRSTGGSPHYDCIQMDGGGDTILIEHNTFMNEQFQTAAVMIDNYAGPMTNITLKDNYLCGGGYTCYYVDNFILDGSAPLTNTYYHNNLLRMGLNGYFLITTANVTSELPERAGNQLLNHGGVFDSAPPDGFVEDQIVPESFHDLVFDVTGSIVGPTVTPETGGVTLGVAFQTTKAGQIASITFGRPSFTSTQTLKIGLWRFTGSTLTGGVELLGSRTFTGLTSAGWTNFEFTTPIDVDAGDNLLAGVFIPRGSDGKCWFFMQGGYFWPSPVPSQWGAFLGFANNPSVPLNGFAGGNGLYQYGPDLTAPLTPDDTDTNFWVDPVFVAPWVI